MLDCTGHLDNLRYKAAISIGARKYYLVQYLRVCTQKLSSHRNSSLIQLNPIGRVTSIYCELKEGNSLKIILLPVKMRDKPDIS